MEIHYINLDRAGDRRGFMERQAVLRGVELRRFRAVEAGDVPEERFRTASRQWQRPVTRTELALFMSHEALWRRAAASAEGIVILEDDAVLSPRFSRFTESAPAGFDLVNLECFERRKFVGGRAVLHQGMKIVPVARDKSGSGAYFLSPAGARKLLGRAETHAAPSDAYLFAVSRLRIGQVEPALTMQVHLLAARGIDAGIVTQTSIHQPRQRLPVTRENMRFHLRRAGAQAGLALLHARRALGLEFRAIAFDEAEFRAILPIPAEV